MLHEREKVLGKENKKFRHNETPSWIEQTRGHRIGQRFIPFKYYGGAPVLCEGIKNMNR